jgi:hypothetical protein
MKRYDSFMFNDELNMLECRLSELDQVMDKFILVEATVTHQGTPKPLHYAENKERFSPWADKIVHVIADDLTIRRNESRLYLKRAYDGDTDESHEAWQSENSQREYVADGLARLDVASDDLIFHGDVDEIPQVDYARHVRPLQGPVVFYQRFHPFAVDWLHPQEWQGTVVGHPRHLELGFSAFRNFRMRPPHTILRDAGWHFTWVSDTHEDKLNKLNAFCHPEIKTEWATRLEECWATGLHVDGGTKLQPVDVVEGEWPKWITDGNAPEGWFRPRG